MTRKTTRKTTRNPALRAGGPGRCATLLAVLGLAVAGCTVEDPLFCEGDDDCQQGHYCDEPAHTCRPVADGGADALGDSTTPPGPDTGRLEGGADARDGGPPDAADAAGDLAGDLAPGDLPPPDAVPPDMLAPDSKLGPGAPCTAAAQCASGYCSDKVCCDKACAGVCDTCAQAGKKGTCVLRPAKTPCGTTTCTGATLKVQQCNGTSAACQTVTSSCAPYKCASSGAACATTCTAHTQCTTGFCDLFDMLTLANTCAPAVQTCYVDASKPCPGSGTQTAPYCTIQACLDKKREYVAVADGTYNENLTLKFNTEIVSIGTTGKLLAGGLPQAGVAKVKLRPAKANTPGVLFTGSYHGVLHGFEITPGSGGSGDLVKVATNGRYAWLSACHLHHSNGGSGLRVERPSTTTYTQQVTVMDTAATFNQYGIYASDSDLTLQGVGLRSNALAGLKHESAKLTVRDAVIQLNGMGVYTIGTTLDLDRLKVSVNSGEGLLLEASTTGVVLNLLAADNLKVGIELYSNIKPPVFANVTVANNGGTEVSCSTDNTFFYNSVVWDKGSTASVAGKCYFEHSDVRGGVAGAGNIDKDPKFVGSGADPYALLDFSSPCVDAGDDSITGVTLPSLDLRLKKRKVDKITTNTAVIDMGAYEVQ